MKLYEGTLVQAAKLNVDLRRPPQHRIVCLGLDLQHDQKYQMLNVFLRYLPHGSGNYKKACRFLFLTNKIIFKKLEFRRLVVRL